MPAHMFWVPRRAAQSDLKVHVTEIQNSRICKHPVQDSETQGPSSSGQFVIWVILGKLVSSWSLKFFVYKWG